MPHALRLAFPLAPDDYNIGSGFLLKEAHRLWLCTAAHIPLMMNKPHKVWSAWPQSVIIPGQMLPPAADYTPAITLPLFGFRPLRPRFVFLDCGQHIADLLLLPMPPDLEAHPTISGHSRFFLGALPAKGDVAKSFGYLKLGTEFSTERHESGVVVEASREVVKTSHLPPKGFSGGPLVSAEGRLLGLSIGHDEGVGVAVSMPAILAAMETLNAPQQP